ncbi:MAG TPA: hypothetical protein VHV32_19145 [Candidatus Angelobacter sp.]|jgi:hypothetical protein|nr:hypothetical protein [Candidatus Angelobacter sp.]
MGAPFGNQNAAKGKLWSAAIQRAIERHATGQAAPTDVSDFVRGLDAAADKFVLALFLANDLAYFKEFGDRMEGRPKQQIEAEITGADGGAIQSNLTVEFVRPVT